jgi:hypothetical protein
MMYGGEAYKGMIETYYPNCKVRRSGCSSLKNTTEFAECLIQNRTTPVDWGKGPALGDPTAISNNLATCS